MSHNFTLPEEIEIVLMELELSELQDAKPAIKTAKNNDQNGWYAKYIPPYRAAYLNGKENLSEAS